MLLFVTIAISAVLGDSKKHAAYGQFDPQQQGTNTWLPGLIAYDDV